MADIRTLFALIPPSQIDDAWVGIVIPHELTHLVFDTAVDEPVPLPAALAQRGPRGLRQPGLRRVGSVASSGAPRRDGDAHPARRPDRPVPDHADGFCLAYAESVSAVDYLVRTLRPDALVALIRSYADGRTDDEAFKAALGVDMTAFGTPGWPTSRRRPPTAYGPQPAPSGPLPSAWAGSAGGATAVAAGRVPPVAPAPSAAASARPASPRRGRRRAGLDGRRWWRPSGLIVDRRARPGGAPEPAAGPAAVTMARTACARSRAGRSRSASRCSRSAS